VDKTISQNRGDAAAVLEMRDCTKAFPGVRALNRVSLTVRTGEVRAILGENGAGKSTLMNILDGVFTDYEGEIRIEGRPVEIRSPRDAQALGIAMIHQELNLVPELSIADNVFLGREPRTRWGTRDRAAMRRGTVTALAELGLDLPPDCLVRRCRLAEQQLIEVAKALAADARILIMDEPTSALPETDVERLFAVIRKLSARGVAVIYISHRLAELAEIADSVTVLRDGELIGTLPWGEAPTSELIRMMVGRTLGELYPRSTHAIDRDRPVLELRGLGLEGDRSEARAPLADLSFAVHGGEIVGLAGLMGAGRSEVLETVFGVHPPRLTRGSVLVDGRPFTRRSPQRALQRGLAYMAEDRKEQSLIVGATVRFNVSLPSLRRYLRALRTIRRRQEREDVARIVASLRVKTPSLESTVRNLSGGNQQKVVLGKMLLTRPRVILMDEPTRGVDIGAKAEIYELIAGLATEGVAILVVSSELPELLALCDRILVLAEGRITTEFAKDEATQEALLAAAMPGGAEPLALGGAA
jgi:ABC-type sugar transport system ATPase subunit